MNEMDKGTAFCEIVEVTQKLQSVVDWLAGLSQEEQETVFPGIVCTELRTMVSDVSWECHDIAHHFFKD